MKLNRTTIASGPKERLPVPPAFDSFKLLERREEFRQIIKRSRHSYVTRWRAALYGHAGLIPPVGALKKGAFLRLTGQSPLVPITWYFLRKNCL